MTDKDKLKGILEDLTFLAFQNAISQGRLSNNPEDKNYTGKYMYMGKTVNGIDDSFKNIITRQYDV